jgi:hypothetical protein
LLSVRESLAVSAGTSVLWKTGPASPPPWRSFFEAKRGSRRFERIR